MFATGTLRITLHSLIALVLSISILGCGDSARSAQASAPPAIVSLNPSSATAGAAAFTLTVTGSGFVSGSAVQWNGSSRTTTYSSATQISAAITAADISAAGTAQILVSNPDAQKSAPSPFAVNAATLPLPTITSLSPNAATAGGAAFTLTVNGTNFRTGAQIEWNGSAIPATTVVSATQLTASIPGTSIATAGTVAVDVLNTDNGGRSATVPFSITASRPVLTSLAPGTAPAGSSALTLTVNGTGFAPDATVAWAGSARTTTFVSSTRLTAAIPATDLAAAGSFAVDVAQGGTRSTNQLSFSVTPVQPTLASLSPVSLPVGHADFDLMITGTNFTSAASVTFNGSAKPTQFVSATQLKASIPASDLATARTVPVDVVQGSVHAVGQLVFTVTAAQPVITSTSPSAATAGGPAFTLTVNGSGFVGTSVVKWNGAALTTAYRTNILLQATVPASNVIAAGTASVTVENPGSEGGVSGAKSFPITAAVPAKIVQLISASYLNGGASNVTGGSSVATLSQDGRYVAFNSFASDLVAGDTNAETDGFLRDTCVGSAPSGCVPSTIRVTQDPGPNSQGGALRLVALSNDARYVGFDTAGQDETDVRDNCIGATGCTPSLEIESYLPDGSRVARLDTCCSILSPDGRYVLFSAFASNLGGLAQSGIFLRDTCRRATVPCSPTTIRVATGMTATPARRPFLNDVSTGGRYVLFTAPGSDIDPALSTASHLFLEDTCFGVSSGCTVTYTAVDVTAAGTEGEGNLANDALADQSPSFSKDGRYVVFSSTDPHMIAGVTSTHISQVYVRDTCIGAPGGCVPLTTLVSDQSGASSISRAFIGFRSVSEHGRYVAYEQEARDIAAGTTTEIPMVRDTCIGAPAGCVPSTSNPTSDPDGVSHVSQLIYFYPSISADGHYVTFMSGNIFSGGGQVYLALTGY